MEAREHAPLRRFEAFGAKLGFPKEKIKWIFRFELRIENFCVPNRSICKIDLTNFFVHTPCLRHLRRLFHEMILLVKNPIAFFMVYANFCAQLVLF